MENMEALQQNDLSPVSERYYSPLPEEKKLQLTDIFEENKTELSPVRKPQETCIQSKIIQEKQRTPIQKTAESHSGKKTAATRPSLTSKQEAFERAPPHAEQTTRRAHTSTSSELKQEIEKLKEENKRLTEELYVKQTIVPEEPRSPEQNRKPHPPTASPQLYLEPEDELRPLEDNGEHNSKAVDAIEQFEVLESNSHTLNHSSLDIEPDTAPMEKQPVVHLNESQPEHARSVSPVMTDQSQHEPAEYTEYMKKLQGRYLSKKKAKQLEEQADLYEATA